MVVEAPPQSAVLEETDDDPILPYLRSVGKAYNEYQLDPDSELVLSRYVNVLRGCVEKFSEVERYRDDVRLHKIMVLYGDAVQDFNVVLDIMEKKGIGTRQWFLYDAAAAFLISKEKILEAQRVFLLGISRKAEPIDKLQKSYSLFLDKLSKLAVSAEPNAEEANDVSPWAPSTIESLLQKLSSQFAKYNGYHKSFKKYSGNIVLASLRKSSRNKLIKLGSKKYIIKGCAGQGGFALVFRATMENNPNITVALKIQSPAFPWEFYMYRQLDERICAPERFCFGFAHGVHIYADWSILICDYLPNVTLQDAINSSVVIGKCMDEVLCIHYTIEMLRMLETLHSVGIIHGDFKPDNLLTRHASVDLPEDAFASRDGPWSEQGLYLVDWGRGIDMRLFPVGTEFTGDSRVSCFRCIQMQEKQKWTYQADAYCLCVSVHMMLHGEYMKVERRTTSDGCCYYQPKTSLKRYWNTELWTNLFSTLLNLNSKENDSDVLRSLRNSFEDYMCKNPKLITNLKKLLEKQKSSLCST